MSLVSAVKGIVVDQVHPVLLSQGPEANLVYPSSPTEKVTPTTLLL